MIWTRLVTIIAVLISAPLIEIDSAPAHPQRDTWRARYRIPASIPFPDENPYTPEKAALGQRLFHDTLLSDDRTRSCASCHSAALAYADGQPRGVGKDGRLLDNHTPSVLNLAWVEGRLGWDGKFADLEGVSFGPITGAANMALSEAEALDRLAQDPSYAPAFRQAFGDPSVTRARVEQAIATYERTLVSGQTPFDRWIAGDREAITPAAQRGFDLFNGRAHCAACHSGWNFTDGSFHDIGVAKDDDLGRGRAMPRSRQLQHAFKTPGLREVAGRGSYMHDGSLTSLDAVLELYSRGGVDRPSRSPEIRTLDLTPEERADLVAFLKTLSAEPGAAPLVTPQAGRS